MQKIAEAEPDASDEGGKDDKTEQNVTSRNMPAAGSSREAASLSRGKVDPLSRNRR
jgi:hypothetical protein